MRRTRDTEEETKITLTEDEWKSREVITLLSEKCLVHTWTTSSPCGMCEVEKAKQYGYYCYTHLSIQVDREKKLCNNCIEVIQRASPEGVSTIVGKEHHRRDHEGITSISQFENTQAFVEARKRNKIPILSEKAAIAIQTAKKILGRMPDINQRRGSMGSKDYGYRSVLWGVNLESGIKVAHALAEAGVTEFRITGERWLTFHLEQHLRVGNLIK